MHDDHKPTGTDHVIKGRRGIVLLAVFTLILVSFAAVFITMNDREEGFQYEEPASSTGDGSLNQDTKERWKAFLSSAPDIWTDVEDVGSDWSDPESLEVLEEINLSTDGEWTPDSPGSDYSGTEEQEGNRDDTTSDSKSDGGENREVEESDIVKVSGERIYLLNPTMGFIIVNVEETSDPFIEGRLSLYGTPVSMYVVDFLAFIVISEQRTYDYPGYGGPSNGGSLYIVDIMDNEDPRVIEKVEVNGTPLDSRRVGDVIYLVSNNYPYYSYWREGGAVDIAVESDEKTSGDPDEENEENEYRTEILSISFSDPESVGEVDRVRFEGTSSHIHASSEAVFIAQSSGWMWEPSGAETTVTYVDISDPKGDIRIRGSVDVDGFMGDRYQMDYFARTFRIVTQAPGDELMESTLYTIDCRDPDDPVVMGSLLIDDAGNLMATRFAGDRAYTIHLPRAVDPLDVIDLSDPYNPELKAVLELPGWIEHMEVRGYNIIALGVDDTEGMWRVALSLFDVEDADDPVMEERVVIGEGYTYSEVNWDPKALSIIDEAGLVLIPYSSRNWRGWGADTGIKIVSFDLEEGELEKRGDITAMYPPRRSRFLNGAVFTVSNREMLSVDIEDPDDPQILATLPIASDIREAFMVGSVPVTVSVPDWGGSGIRIRVHEPGDVDSVSGSFGPTGLQFEGVERIGKIVYIKGIRQGDGVETPLWEVRRYDMTDPSDPVISGPYSIEVPERHLTTYYGKGYPEYDIVEETGGKMSEDGAPEDDIAETERLVTWDPFTWIVAGEDSMVVNMHPYYYDVANDDSDEELILIRWIEGELEGTYLNKRHPYVSDAYSNGERTVIVQNNYNTDPMLSIYEWKPDGVDHIGDTSVTGRLIAMSSNLTIAYTEQYYWEPDETEYEGGYYYGGKNHHVLLTYLLKRTGAELLQAIEIDPGMSVNRIGDDVLMLTEGYRGYYPVYSYDDIAYEEVAVGREMADESPEPNTTVSFLILEEGVPALKRNLTLGGSFRFSYVADDLVMLQEGHRLIRVDLSDMGDPSVEDKWKVPGHVVDGDDGIVAMGLWGSQLLG